MRTINVEIEILNEKEFLERLEEIMDFVFPTYLRRIAGMLCEQFNPDEPFVEITLKGNWINSPHEELIAFEIVSHEYNDGHEKITFRYIAD